MNRTFPSAFQIIKLILLACILQACDPSSEASSKQEGSPASISGYNYTIEGIQEFFVNGQWGGGVSIGGGYGQTCCVILPDKWRPGLTVEVEWRRSDCGGNGPGNERCPFGTKGEGWHYKTLKTTVPIERYEKPGSLQVMFLPDDQIKIYASLKDPEHPEHPAKLGRPHPIGHPEWKRD